MPLAAGTRLGPYEVLAPLGAGGMGEVYRARDTRLDRVVAIKTLPESFAQDPDRVARFEREAKTLAALNHPNIAIIYGVEGTPSNGSAPGVVPALVMELVEGPTLAERLADGSIALADALPIARQITDALEAAHQQGIVHRDLKPGNIKLRPDGTVKVLDFGLAKALSADAGGGSVAPLSFSPTITSPALMTGMGMILGTAAYMSPEQARGKPVDKRADIWAFGCVLYEMLTGRPAFDGAEVTDVLARVIEREPDASALPAKTPVPIRRLLRRCLEKDRKRRLADIADARLEIDDAVNPPQAEAPIEHRPAARVSPRRYAIAVAVLIGVALAAAYAAWRLKPVPARAIARFEIPLAAGDVLTGGLALSPDGTHLAYGVNDRLYLRSFDRLDAVQIASGENVPLGSPRTPFFSPDSKWLGYWESGQLKKVSVTGGAPVSLGTVRPPPTGVTWPNADTILFGREVQGIWRLSANGGTPERVISLEAGQRAHRPQLLPDGSTVLFTLATTASWDEAQIVAQPLGGGERRTLVPGGTDGRYLPTGHLIYALRDSVLAVPFDPTSLSIAGGPVPVIEGVFRPAGSRSSAASITTSLGATLAYVTGGAMGPLRTLVWVDRRGREQPIPAPAQAYVHPRISPDGTRVAVEYAADNQNIDVWVWNFADAQWTRVTTDPAPDTEPAWSPDGQRLFFTSRRTGTINLFRQAATGAGTAEHVVELNRQSRALPTLSPDGQSVVLREADGGNSFIAIAPISSPPVVAKPLLTTEFEEYNAVISPNGRWLAYQSNSSGPFEVYVRPFPDVTSDVRTVSTAGGAEPVWSHDGSELFYRSPNGAMMRVSIAPGPTWSASAPTQLFEAGLYAHAANANLRVGLSRSYDVSPDGQRFLMLKNLPGETPIAPRIVVVQNWFDELNAKAPPN